MDLRSGFAMASFRRALPQIHCPETIEAINAHIRPRDS
jgi:hypothetical protein